MPPTPERIGKLAAGLVRHEFAVTGTTTLGVEEVCRLVAREVARAVGYERSYLAAVRQREVTCPN